jgi:pimeloyl-ACP methyl ester carboxylesterase
MISLIFAGGCETKEAVQTSESAGERPTQGKSTLQTTPKAEGQYASVNGLKMYYEIHGTGQPLVSLHGAFGFANPLPALAQGRKVIAVEMQGHGHTGDIDRDMTIEQLADDLAALLDHLEVAQADFFGYSLGGNVALAVAIRHPQRVRKLVINGSNAGPIADTYEPETYQQFKNLPANFAPPMLKGPYDQVAPNPANWPVLVTKIKKMGLEFQGFSREDMKSITAQVLITLGDRDGVRLEHAVEMYRQIPNAQLAVFPGTDHFLIFQRPDELLPVITKFLDAQIP